VETGRQDCDASEPLRLGKTGGRPAWTAAINGKYQILVFAALLNFDLLAFGPTGYGDELFWGALRTVQIAVSAYAVGVSLGLCGAMGKLSGGKWLGRILDGYTTLVRAVPELVLILLLYYAGTDGINRMLLSVGLNPIEINGLVAAVFVLGFVQGAYSTEVLRAAIQAIPVGQIEAAKAYGMSPFLRFRRVVIPAMLPFAIPGMANLWLNITKDSALIAVVGFTELALATRQAAGVSKLYLMFYIVTALIYLAISLCSNQIFGWLERRVRRGQPKLA
jgi:polar amino acid transport system permease protein